MKVGDLVQTYAGIGIIIEYHERYDTPGPYGGYPWYVWMLESQRVDHFRALNMEVISETIKP